ncbi:MAG: helix-turn-helix transcriptional regulator [Coriobacteriales bacterium]
MSGLTHDDIWGEEKGFAMKALKNGSHREDGSIPVMGSISDEQRFVLFPEAEKIDMREQLSTRYPHSFFLHVFGESMNRVFPNDCLILIDHLQREVIDGEIYAVRINSSQATVRRARRAGAKLELIPDSWDSSYETIELDWAPDNPDGGQVLGRMVWCCPPPGKKL